MLANWFGRRLVPPFTPTKRDLSSLERGLDDLRKTTAEVTEAAILAAKMLDDEHRRIKACFIALNSASDAICILDHAGQIYFCNDQFLQNNNIDEYDDVVGVHIHDVLPNIPDFQRVWESCQSNHTEIIKCPDTNLMMTIVPMMNGAPKPIYYACTFKMDKQGT